MKISILKILFISAIFVTLSACKMTSQLNADVDLTLLHDDLFKVQDVESEQEIYALDTEITEQLDHFIKSKQSPMTQAKQLLNFLMSNGEASLSYQTGANLTATQAYNNLNANCLSLSILAHSLSEYLGLKTQFQRVQIPEYWDQTRGYSMLTGHVNLIVSIDERNTDGIHLYFNQPRSITVDFDPNSRSEKFPTYKIDKSRITAMFYNNKGAMHMIAQQHDLAYSYFRAAIKVDPLYSSAWGNLGILYRIKREYTLAEKSYDQALVLKPNSFTAMGNKAILFNLTERTKQAEDILTMLHNKRRHNPYYFIVLANEALEKNQLAEARSLFIKAKRLDSSLHNSYFGLSKVYFHQGDLKLAEFYLNQALKLAPFEHDKNRYKNKLSALYYLAGR